MTLPRVQVREIGLKSIWISCGGETLALGEQLLTFIDSGASSGANDFKTLFGIISGPIAFPTLKLDKESCTSLTLARRPGGLVDWLMSDQ